MSFFDALHGEKSVLCAKGCGLLLNKELRRTSLCFANKYVCEQLGVLFAINRFVLSAQF